MPSGITCFDPVQRRFLSGPPQPDHIPVPSLDGVLSTHDADLAWAAEDFGRVVRHRPLAVARPGSLRDVCAIQRFAHQHAIPVVPRAEGHSTGGQAQTPDGMVLDMRGFDTVGPVAADHVTVEAGARWSDVLTATLAHGLTPPVLTDYLELSVGGTLSVGGLGGTSRHHGAHTDNVLQLDVVTPDGSHRTCSPTVEPALFDAVRAGRGRHGVIVRATLRLIPAHTHARRHILRYNRLSDLLADQRRLASDRRVDYLEGKVKPDDSGTWTYQLEATTYFTPPSIPDSPRLLEGLGHITGGDTVTDTGYRDFLDRMADDVALLRTLGPWQHPHPWSNTLLADHTAEELITRTLSELDRQSLGSTGLALVYPILRTRLATPLLKVPDTPIVFLFSVLRTADSPDTLTGMVEHNHRIHDRVTASGGATYLDPIPDTEQSPTTSIP
ncbi:FAD-binding protein [Actinosynnema sp. CS-041913]|uniref:FAD-binding protein n=1 Tax=Actinosynnema sp. CS-041913 TaxID=3239917 RepID=UPI003D8DCA54